MEEVGKRIQRTGDLGVSVSAEYFPKKYRAGGLGAAAPKRAGGAAESMPARVYVENSMASKCFDDLHQDFSARLGRTAYNKDEYVDAMDRALDNNDRCCCALRVGPSGAGELGVNHSVPPDPGVTTASFQSHARRLFYLSCSFE